VKAPVMNRFQRLASTAALELASLAAQASPVVVDVSGAQSVNLQGEAGNTVWLVNIGAGAVLNSLDWAVTLNAFAPSSLSEMQVSFGSSSGLDLITFAPDELDGFSGAGSYTGSLDLSAFGIAAGADGLLRIEFSETYKDFAAGVAEGRWLGGVSSSAMATVPEPGSLALAGLSLALVGASRRRRRA